MPDLRVGGADGDPALTRAAGVLTNGELRDLVAKAAQGYRSGERVAVCSADPVEVLVAVLAAARAGATAVVVDPGWPAGRRKAALAAARAGEIVETGSAEPVFWIGFTSGSAGTPRPIARTASSWTSSFAKLSELAGLGPGATVLVPGSLASSMFMFGALHTLWAGGNVVAGPSSAAGRDPVPDAVYCVPTTLADIVRRVPSGTRLGLTAICGGAALPDSVRTAAATAGIGICEYYGATELSFVAWRDPDGRLLPFPGVEMAIRDGVVWARSPYLCSGYAAEVSGPLRWDDCGYATVGDLGELGADGSLRILGRADGTILTGGAPILPEDVEAVLAEVPGVGDVVVLGTRHERLGAVVTAVIEPAVGVAATDLAAERATTVLAAAPRLAELRAVAAERLSAAQRPRRWYLVDRLPRTNSGKPARATIAAGLERGTLPVRRPQ